MCMCVCVCDILYFTVWRVLTISYNYRYYLVVNIVNYHLWYTNLTASINYVMETNIFFSQTNNMFTEYILFYKKNWALSQYVIFSVIRSNFEWVQHKTYITALLNSYLYLRTYHFLKDLLFHRIIARTYFYNSICFK